MKRYLLIATLFISWQPMFAQPEYEFKHFTTDDGLLSNKVRDIIQDSLGFIWFFHSTHLTRYDGYNFKVYKHEPGNSSKLPRSGLMGWPFLDPSGNIWVNNLYLAGDLLQYDRKSDRFMKYSPRIRKAASGPVYFDKDKKTLWLPDVGGGGFYSFNTETLETKDYYNLHKDSLTNRLRNSIRSIHDRDSFLLLCTRQGLWKFQKSTKIFTRPECNPKDSTFLYNFSEPSIIDWASYHENWISIANVLIRFNSDLDIVERIIFPDTLELGSLDRDEQGVFWIPTQDGLYRYDPGNRSLISFRSVPGEPNSLRSNLVTHVAVDNEQNIWTTTFGTGVSKLTRQSLRLTARIFPDKSLPAQFFRQMALTIWLSTKELGKKMKYGLRK